MHRILERQLERFLGGTKNVPPQWQGLLDAVNDTYLHFDEDRALLDRSLDLSSKEFLDTNKRLQEAKEKVEEIVKQRTLELQQERARLLSSIESLSLGFAIFDAQGGIFHANRVFSEVLELTGGTNIKDIETQLAGKIKLQKLFEDVLKNPESVDTKNIPFGKRFLRIFATRIIVAASGEIIGAVMVVEDTTQEQQMDRAKSEFVVLASHQLRTPLTIIKWHTELLRKRIDTLGEVKDVKKHTVAIEEGIIRMSALVHALLNVSRIEVGKLAINPKLLDAAELCHSVSEELQSAFDEKKLKLTEDYAKGLPQVNADPELLRVVVQNLLTNSIKYSQDAGTVKVSLQKAAPGQVPPTAKSGEEFLILSVTDDGLGIPKEQQSKIFTKLFRADNVKLTKTSGTGLGLYITKAVVESTGGSIWFESPAPGMQSGTAFYVIISVAGVGKKEGVAFSPDEIDKDALYS